MESDLIFTTDEAAEFLKTTRRTIEEMARRGDLPAVKVGKEWRFHLEALADWVRAGRLVRSAPKKQKQPKPPINQSPPSLRPVDWSQRKAVNA